MRMTTRLGITLALGAMSLIAAGCASLGPTYKPVTNAPKDKATVYVYRPSGFGGAAISYTVAANGVDISKLPSGGYFVYYAKPGETEFSAKTEAQTSVTIDAKAGQAYYVKGTIGMGVFVGHPHLVQVDGYAGEEEITKCKLVPPAGG